MRNSRPRAMTVFITVSASRVALPRPWAKLRSIEGIETSDQAAVVDAARSDQVQGFFFGNRSRPQRSPRGCWRTFNGKCRRNQWPMVPCQINHARPSVPRSICGETYRRLPTPARQEATHITLVVFCFH
jgi:EAL domain-containing protein (putative c-di-GMP-specific phosphodiesterase class I)